MGMKGLPKRNAQPLEADIQRAILAWLHGLKVLAWRSNSGAMSAPATATTARRFVRFNGIEGLSDISAVLPGGRACFIEVKREGNGPTEKQQAFLDLANREGAVAFVARSVADVERALRLEGFRVVRGRLVKEV